MEQGYTGEWFATAAFQMVGANVDVIKRNEFEFKVLPKRWIVEHTFSSLGQNHRLSKDYELLSEASEAMIYIAMVRLMLRRLTKTKIATS